MLLKPRYDLYISCNKLSFSEAAIARTTKVQAGNNCMAGTTSIAKAIKSFQRYPKINRRVMAVTASNIQITGGNNTTAKPKASEITAISMAQRILGCFQADFKF